MNNDVKQLLQSLSGEISLAALDRLARHFDVSFTEASFWCSTNEQRMKDSLEDEYHRGYAEGAAAE